MKNLILMLFFTVLSVFSVYANDYQIISSGRIAYFSNYNNSVNSIRIDSVKFQSDSILYPFTNFQQNRDYSYSPDVSSWIGKRIIIKENGINQIINRDNDTITINTLAKIGDMWTFFKSSDTLIIIASVSSIDTMSFAEISDTVKTIQLKAFDKDMNQIESDINNLEIIISKNYGFVKIPGLYYFPEYIKDYSSNLIEYDLVGMSNPKFGIQNLTWFDVNDFQVGDELHVEQDSIISYDNLGNSFSEKILSIYKYMNRIDYPDSIIYTYSLTQSKEIIVNNSSTNEYLEDTVTVTIKPDPIFDKLPGEPIIKEDYGYNNYMFNDSILTKINPGYGNCLDYNSTYSKWSEIIYDGYNRVDKFLKGLSGPYFDITSVPLLMSMSFRKLVYYKKGDIIWGNPLSISGIEENKLKENIKVYPNPAENFISISNYNQLNTDCSLSIYDAFGRLILDKKLNLIDTRINISELSTGVYFYKIQSNSVVIKSDKLIVK